MAIDKFRQADIILDRANSYVLDNHFGMEGDYNGRELLVQITNKGVVEDTEGLKLNLGWYNRTAKNNGLNEFIAVDTTQGLYKIRFDEAMMNKGNVNATIQIIDGESVIYSRPFTIKIGDNPINIEAVITSDSFTALNEALLAVNSIKEIADAELNQFFTDLTEYWQTYVDSVQDILGAVDPGGVLLNEVVNARKPEEKEPYETLGKRIDGIDKVAYPIEEYLLTVGQSGDYQSLNAALADAASRRAGYTGYGFNIEVRLLSGFILTEQVYVRDQDLSFITITAEDEIVEIDASTFGNNVNEEPYATGLLLQSAAAFTGYGIAKLPLIDCSFDFKQSGVSGRTNGIFLIYGAEFRMARGRKFVNGLSSGLSVMEGSKAYVTDTEFSGFNGNNIACYRGSYVLFRGGKANASVSGYGVYLDNLCQMDAAMADFSGNSKTNVWLSGQSLLSANNAKFNNSKTGNGLNVDGASVADVHNSEFNNNAQNGIYSIKSSVVDANACQAKNNTQMGVFVSSLANVNASDAVITENGSYSVRCNYGGFLNVTRANCRKAEGANGADARVDYNGYIIARDMIGGLSGVAQGNVINQNGLILNNDPIPEDLGTLGANIQSRVVFSQIKNNSCASSMIPLSKTTKKTIVIKTVAIHESGSLSADEIALLSVEKYLDGFCLTTKNSELSTKLSSASAKIYFDSTKIA